MQERDVNILKDSMLNSETIMVCDGSDKNGYGAAAYIITTASTLYTGAVTGNARTTGHPEIQDSYRAKLTGILAGLLHFQTLIDLWDLQDKELTLKVVCDNIEALKVSFDYDLHPRISAKYNHCDLIYSIQIYKWANVTLKYEHIYGHQDKHITRTNLSLLASLNVDMDFNCRAARTQLEIHAKPTNWIATLPNWKHLIIINEKIIVTSIEQTINKTISNRKMQLVLNNKHNLTEDNYNDINWNCIAKAMKQSKEGQQRWISKHHSGMCGVNKWRKIWKDRDDDCCPRCDQTEDGSHIYLCDHTAVSLLWQEAQIKLSNWLEDSNTKPSITKGILCCLDLLYSNKTEREITDLVQMQQHIGLERFFEGELHVQWAQQQGDYYDSMHSKCLGQVWCTKLILQLWDIRWQFWEDRNNTEHLNDNDQLQITLNNDIEAEINVGFDALHQKYNQQTTTNYIEKILDSPNVELKRSWLRNIRAGRNAPPIPIVQRPIANLLDTSHQLITQFFPSTTTPLTRMILPGL